MFKMDYMDEKSNLYVFERKEVFLIFVFMILIGVTSFILGVKVGKQYSFEKAGFEQVDRETVDLLSKKEEEIHDGSRPTEVQLDTQDLRQKMNENLEKKIFYFLISTFSLAFLLRVQIFFQTPGSKI